MYDEDTISLRDDEPITHEPFNNKFDEIDAMVLDRYNTTSMAMGTEASLFMQVPSAHMLMTLTCSLYLCSICLHCI